MHTSALVIDLTVRERAADPFCFVSSGLCTAAAVQSRLARSERIRQSGCEALLLDLRKTHQQPAHFDICLLHKV